MKGQKRARLLCILLAGLMLISGCGTSSGAASPTVKPPQGGTTSDPIIKYDKIHEITWLRVAEEPLSTQALEFILLNFGLSVTEKHIRSQNMSQRVLDMYVSDMSPNLATGISTATAKELVNRGHLRDLSGDRGKLENYYGLWTDGAAWEYTKKELADGVAFDGEYFLVPVNRRTSLGWIYNSDVFEDEDFNFPKTVEGLYSVLTSYKERHSAASVLWTNEYESLHLKALLNAYGLTDEAWQADEYGNVFYLYAQEEWYKSLEWLYKFMKLGVVPSKDGKVVSYTSSEYDSVASAGKQIVEFTNTYNYLYLTDVQDEKWTIADSLIAADNTTTPVLQLNSPYIDEATCISAATDDEKADAIMQFLNWLASDDGIMWSSFGAKDECYTVNDNGEMEFSVFYSDEVTPRLDPDDGKVSDYTIGRLFTTTPWDKVKVAGYVDRYTAQEAFLDKADVRFVYESVFCAPVEVTEDKTLLWKYDNIRKELDELSAEFMEYSLENGFSDYYWGKYYSSLLEAGLEEYTAFMQTRKIR